MSAVMASSTNEATIFVRLLDEGTDVWRPVKARRLGENTYSILEEVVPEDEVWSFQPGGVVVVEHRPEKGVPDSRLIAVARAVQFDEKSWNHLRKTA